MPVPDLRTAIDNIWPDVERTRNKCWYWLGGIFVTGWGMTAIVSANDGALAFPIIITFIFMIGALIFSIHAVRNKTRPLADRVMKISGFEDDEITFDMDKLRAAGVLPSGTSVHLKDSIFTKTGQFRIDRLETHLTITTGSGDNKKKKTYFAGYVVAITGLKAQQPMTLLVESRGRSYGRLRKFMRAHQNPSMRHEETCEIAPIGEISIFGDGAWNQEDAISSAAQKNIDTLVQIQTTICNPAETIFSMHFGIDFCAVAISTNESRLKLGGLALTKPKLAENVDDALVRLGRTLETADALISHRREAEDVPEKST